MLPKTIYRTILLVIFVLSLTAMTLAGGIVAQDAPPSGCPAGQGYWKNTATWPVSELILGGQTYTQVELLILLNTPVAGDASLNLAHQLIAAKLNLLNGADALLATDLIAQGDLLLAAYPNKLPLGIDSSSADGGVMVNLAGVLDSYNSGLLTVNCAPVATLTPTPESTAEATPEATPDPNQSDLPITIVIEGPVQAINVNIITIYNFNIQLDNDAPILNIIQIGDVLHVEGNTQSVSGTIVIVAVNIIILNVDINVDTGEYWRDDGNCSNPPPPWAPAHGWRRHCGDPGVTIIIQPGNQFVVPQGCKITGRGHLKCSKKT